MTAPLTRVERRVLDAVDVGALVDHLAALIAMDTSAGQETPAQDWVAELMAEIGLEVDRWELDLDALRSDSACSEELGRDRAVGVVGRLGAGSFREPPQGPTLVLNGHVDVVPAGERRLWTVPPFEATVRDGKVYGRGSADMKGGLLAGLFAMRAVRDAGVRLAGSVLFQSVAGEEDGGIGTLAAVRRGHTGDGAIVLEPTRLVVAPAQAGAFNFRVTVPGRAAHGALRSEGVDPIDRFIPIYRAIQALEKKRNARPRHALFRDAEIPYAVCVGTIRGGVWASTVAESVTIEGRLGIAPDEDPTLARQELESVVAESVVAESGVAEASGHQGSGHAAWLREHPPVLEWWGGQFMPAATDRDHAVVTTVEGAHRVVTAVDADVRGMPYGADMRLLANEGGTPTVLYGPGDVRSAHAPDEHVEIAELETATKVLALSIVRFCQGDAT